MLSTEAQQALPHDAQVALQQVDNRMYPSLSSGPARAGMSSVVGLACD